MEAGGWNFTSFKPPSNPNHSTIPPVIIQVFSSRSVTEPRQARKEKSQIHQKNNQPRQTRSQCPPPSTERSHPSFICHLPPSLRGLLWDTPGPLSPPPLKDLILGRGWRFPNPRASLRTPFLKRRNLQRALAQIPPLRSRVGDGAALPDPASPGILQQKGTTEEFSSSFFSEEFNSSGEGKNKGLLFYFWWRYLGFSFFVPLFVFSLLHGKFLIFPIQGCSENLNGVIKTRRGPHELFPNPDV